MCEVWKAVAIASMSPFVLIIAVDLTKWRFESRRRWRAWLTPYQRLLWLDLFVLVVSLVIVVTHCVE